MQKWMRSNTDEAGNEFETIIVLVGSQGLYSLPLKYDDLIYQHNRKDNVDDVINRLW